MKTRFHDNPAYVAYERLLVQLHELIAEGRGDEPEADALRDSMEEHEPQLDETELTRLGNLSADLYMLSGQEIFRPSKQPPFQRDELLKEIRYFQQWNDWEAVLGLLRQRGPDVPAEAAAITRARAYDALGHTMIALRFLEFAYRQRRDDMDYLAYRLMLLRKAGSSNEALGEARRYARLKGASPRLLIECANLLIEVSEDTSEATAAELRLQALEILERALPATGNSALAEFALLLKSECMAHLKRHDEAVAALDRILDINPNDDDVRSLRETLLAGNEDDGIAAFGPVLEHFRNKAFNGMSAAIAA